MNLFVNLTPHEITIVTDTKGTIRIPASGYVTRISTESVHTDSISMDGALVPIYTEVYGELNFLDPNNNIVEFSNIIPDNIRDIPHLIMSRLAADAFLNIPRYKQYQLYCPGALLRNTEGEVVGCKGLIKLR